MITSTLTLCALVSAVPGAPAEKSVAGRVAFVAGDLVFDEPTARELCPDAGSRLCVAIGTPASDVLARLGSPTPLAPIDVNAPYPGDGRDLARRARSVRCLVLAGGTWLEWWHALKPDGKLTLLGRAVLEAHQAGASVIGLDAAGAYMAQWCMLSRETLNRPARDPHDPTEDILLAGLGLVRDACVDLATDGRDSPERMVEVARASGVDLSIWLAGPCAWIQDGDGRNASVRARVGSAYVFDLSRALRSREALFGGMLSVLGDGDRFDGLARIASSRSGPTGAESPLDVEPGPPRAGSAAPDATWRSHLGPTPAQFEWNASAECALNGARSVLLLHRTRTPPRPNARESVTVGGAIPFDCWPISR